MRPTLEQVLKHILAFELIHLKKRKFLEMTYFYQIIILRLSKLTSRKECYCYSEKVRPEATQ